MRSYFYHQKGGSRPLLGRMLLSWTWYDSRRICFLTSYLILFDTTSRIMGDRADQRLAPPSGNLTPPRISPSCPHCVWLWLDSEYRLTVSSQDSLPKLLWAEWIPLVTLYGRLSCGCFRTGESSRTCRIACPPRQGPVN